MSSITVKKERVPESEKERVPKSDCRSLQPVPETRGSFVRGFVIGVPIALALWALIFWLVL